MIRPKARILLSGIALCIASVLFSAQAQEQKINLPNKKAASATKENLVAEKTKKTMELLAIDSMLMDMAIEKEREFGNPADDLYCGKWSSEYVKAYNDIVTPDEYDIRVSEFVLPTDGKVTSRYGWRKRRMHNGIDLKLQTGDSVRAAFDGKVRIKKFERRGYGYYVVLRHSNGLETVYGHLSKFLVDENEYVKAGQVIGLGGNTGRSFGSHLHFEFRFLGHPINPEEIVDFENACIKDDYYTFRKSNVGNTTRTKYTAGNKTSTKGNPANSGKSVKYHKIKDGDTLGAIAQKHRTTVNRLCKLNNLKPTSTLRVGRSIRIS